MPETVPGTRNPRGKGAPGVLPRRPASRGGLECLPGSRPPKAWAVVLTVSPVVGGAVGVHLSGPWPSPRAVRGPRLRRVGVGRSSRGRSPQSLAAPLSWV